jgi:hypothetical protein
MPRKRVMTAASRPFAVPGRVKGRVGMPRRSEWVKLPNGATALMTFTGRRTRLCPGAAWVGRSCRARKLLVITTALFSPVQIGLAATDWWMVDSDTGACTRSAEIATKEGSIALKTPEQLVVFLQQNGLYDDTIPHRLQDGRLGYTEIYLKTGSIFVYFPALANCEAWQKTFGRQQRP